MMTDLRIFPLQRYPQEGVCPYLKIESYGSLSVTVSIKMHNKL